MNKTVSNELEKKSSFNVQRHFVDFAKKYCLSRLELLQGKQDVKICILVSSTTLGRRVNAMLNV